MKKVFILVLVIIIIGVLLWAKGSNRTLQVQSVQPSLQPLHTVSNHSGMIVERNAIYVSGQGESNDLTISMVMLDESGYVVIYADSKGHPDVVLGYSELLLAGTHNNVSIHLSRKTVKGETIYAMLHKDNGDKLYSSADAPIKGKNGQPIMMIVNVGNTNESSPSAVSM